jgi:hypothetical protein
VLTDLASSNDYTKLPVITRPRTDEYFFELLQGPTDGFMLVSDVLCQAGALALLKNILIAFRASLARWNRIRMQVRNCCRHTAVQTLALLGFHAVTFR